MKYRYGILKLFNRCNYSSCCILYILKSHDSKYCCSPHCKPSISFLFGYCSDVKFCLMYVFYMLFHSYSWNKNNTYIPSCVRMLKDIEVRERSLFMRGEGQRSTKIQPPPPIPRTVIRPPCSPRVRTKLNCIPINISVPNSLFYVIPHPDNLDRSQRKTHQWHSRQF